MAAGAAGESNLGPMPDFAQVTIHPSQFPGAVRRDLLASLRSRRVNHKFHYDSIKQTQKWLALHQAFSPSRNDADCAAIYERGFEAAATRIGAPQVAVVGLGCGGGQKDAKLLKLLRAAGKEVVYMPVDVSTAMVLVARAEALKLLPPPDCFPLVCDLATMNSWAPLLEVLPTRVASMPRLFTFFGMLPNFDSEVALPRLAGLLGPRDTLLLSANLAPGTDYDAGVRRILPLYDNALTRDWLLAFLVDLGVEVQDGALEFGIETANEKSGLKRVTVDFVFNRPRELRLDEEVFHFAPGEKIRLFFSCRHTPAMVESLLASQGLRLKGSWIAKSDEEAVFEAVRA